jgi:hypothetical protein
VPDFNCSFWRVHTCVVKWHAMIWEFKYGFAFSGITKTIDLLSLTLFDEHFRHRAVSNNRTVNYHGHLNIQIVKINTAMYKCASVRIWLADIQLRLTMILQGNYKCFPAERVFNSKVRWFIYSFPVYSKRLLTPRHNAGVLCAPYSRMKPALAWCVRFCMFSMK